MKMAEFIAHAAAVAALFTAIILVVVIAADLVKLATEDDGE